MRFLAIACALMGAALAAPTEPVQDNPPPYSKLETGPSSPPYNLHGSNRLQIIDLRYRLGRLHFIKSLSSKSFQLIDVTLKVGDVTTVCRGIGKDHTSIQCDNPDFSFKVTRTRIFSIPDKFWVIETHYQRYWDANTRTTKQVNTKNEVVLKHHRIVKIVTSKDSDQKKDYYQIPFMSFRLNEYVPETGEYMVMRDGQYVTARQ